MKRLLFLCLSVLLGCKDNQQTSNLNGVRGCPVITVRFSPKGGITQSIVEGIDGAEYSVYVHAFGFTSDPIAEAIIRAKKRSVSVEVVVDRENLRNKNSVISLLHDNNIPVYVDSNHAIQHNKVIIIDGNITYTGSANLSRAANENNAENSVKINDAAVAQLYLENWTLHKEHSALFSPENK